MKFTALNASTAADSNDQEECRYYLHTIFNFLNAMPEEGWSEVITEPAPVAITNNGSNEGNIDECRRSLRYLQSIRR